MGHGRKERGKGDGREGGKIPGKPRQDLGVINLDDRWWGEGEGVDGGEGKERQTSSGERERKSREFGGKKGRVGERRG